MVPDSKGILFDEANIAPPNTMNPISNIAVNKIIQRQALHHQAQSISRFLCQSGQAGFPHIFLKCDAPLLWNLLSSTKPTN